jgi:hypothetical protein
MWRREGEVVDLLWTDSEAPFISILTSGWLPKINLFDMYDNYTSLNKIIVVGIHKKKKILQSVQSDESDIF